MTKKKNSGGEREYRTVFISDTHLGCKISQTESLLEFLKTVKTEKLYLAGDIIDITGLRRRFYWDSSHNAVIRRLLKMVKNGVTVIYIPGNHDHFIRDFNGLDFSGIQIKTSDIHETADSRRLLVIHGDEFDGIMNEKMMWLYTVGDRCYDAAVALSRVINSAAGLFGVEWSLSRYLKTKVKNVVAFINGFERLLARKARSMRLDGVVSGHIHTAGLKVIDGVLCANCGCWTESRDAVAEDFKGELSIIKWPKGKADENKETGGGSDAESA
jgi:UDP-2,3-diacylglucosamine pyrophosphatase LpxH